jgi:phosphate transport system permease protein
MANAIVGSMVILAIASLLGVPLGIGAGVFLSEYGRNRYGDIVRFVSDVLNGVPSIVIGIVAYGLVVMRQKHFSALAGGVALAIMMIPTIARTTEQMLLLVPQALREAAYGLGVSRWRTTLSITLRARDLGSDHGHHAGLCPGGGRNGAAAVYRLWKPVLELEDRPADGGLVAADFHLRDFAV